MHLINTFYQKCNKFMQPQKGNFFFIYVIWIKISTDTTDNFVQLITEAACGVLGMLLGQKLTCLEFIMILTHVNKTRPKNIASVWLWDISYLQQRMSNDDKKWLKDFHEQQRISKEKHLKKILHSNKFRIILFKVVNIIFAG